MSNRVFNQVRLAGALVCCSAVLLCADVTYTAVACSLRCDAPNCYTYPTNLAIWQWRCAPGAPIVSMKLGSLSSPNPYLSTRLARSLLAAALLATTTLYLESRVAIALLLCDSISHGLYGSPTSFIHSGSVPRTDPLYVWARGNTKDSRAADSSIVHCPSSR